MYEYALTFLNNYVEIYTYLTQEKLYGEIVEVTPLQVVLQRKYIDKSSNNNYNLYIPMNSIISIKKL
ncbi:ATPase [Romboutsia sedimentorum]|uniref:ATPase n=1 Tax=Romboutsia sedimentorum TaxID=1368474 RepID=A0ABT7E4S4_9FIRM|nr:ATPase [Romboutsia sedimentorum]MDK2561928.1 ATPase [Romboutsia sedimentorum]MDK2586722.1 ATPase [Romboutsia sedimentorum]